MSQRPIDGDYVYFITTNVHNGMWFFNSPERANVLGEAIITCCHLKKFNLLSFCILPNHLHILIRKNGVNEKITSPDSITTQHKPGGMRCVGGLMPVETADIAKKTNQYLYSNRRRPRRRSLQKNEHYRVSQLMHSIKSTFSHALDVGKFWHRGYFFRVVDNEQYFSHLIDYIRYNYRKMNLNEDYGKSPFVFIDWEAIHDTLKN